MTDPKVRPESHERPAAHPGGARLVLDQRTTPSPAGRRGMFPAVPLGFTVWITGLSGAGKSTIAAKLAAALRQASRKVEVLDGDEIRATLNSDLGFSKEARDTNVRRLGFVARLLARNGVAVIVAAISPYREVRDEVRAAIAAEGCGFVEVHARCSIDELARRDVKGLYQRALRGELHGFTGVSDPYEEPLNPDVTFDSGSESEEDSLRRLLRHLETKGFLAAVSAT